MSKPLVSVLMTAYNREKYIAQAIESVLSSSYSNFELIIVDDCSKDRTVEIAVSYAAKNNQIKVFVNEQNLGDYLNRNKAASYAQGKYIKYVDADDLIYPHGLEVMVNMMERFPEAGFGLCSIPQDKRHMFPFSLTPKDAYRYHYIEQKGIFLRAPLSSIISKTVFENVNGFINSRMVGDYELWHRLALQTPVVLMPQGLIWYRHHEEQEMSSHSKFLLDYLKISEHYVLGSQLDEKEKVLTLDKLRRHQLVKLIKNPMSYSLRDRYSFYRNSNISLKNLIRNTSFFH